MHENSGNSVIYYAHYTEGGVNKTGLTVTITVYEVIRDGTKTEVVTDGACTEIGDGLYRYLLASGTVDAAAEYVAVFHTATNTVDAQDIPAIWVIDRAGTEKLDTGITLADDAITAAKFDESTAFPLKSADTGATQVARVGADSDTLETLSDEIAAVKAETAAILVDTGTDGVKIASAQTVATVTNLTNLPSIPANWITAAGVATGAIDADAIASNAITSAKIATGAITNAKFASGAINAAAIATDAIGSDEISAAAVTKIQNGLALEATLTAIKGAGWTNETLVTLKAYVDEIETRLTAARAGYLDKLNVTGTLAHSDAAATYKADVSGLAPANEYDARMTAIQADLDNPDQYKADVSTLATQASVNAIPTTPLLAANYVAPDNAGIADIKAKTDNLPASPAPANEYDTELAALQADLDNADQYKADVSGLATTAHVQEVENKVDAIDVTTVASMGKIDALDVKVSAIDTDSVMNAVVDGAYTFEQVVQIMAAALAGKLSRTANTLTFRDLSDTLDRIVAETDVNKQRTDMTYTV